MNEPNDQHDELRDRLLDQALRETLGAESPPDLTDRILAAAQQQTSELPQPKGEGVMERPKGKRWGWVVVGASACILVVAGVALLQQAAQGTRTAHELALKMESQNYHDSHQALPSPGHMTDDVQYSPPGESPVLNKSPYVTQPGSTNGPHYVVSKPVHETEEKSSESVRQPLMPGDGVQHERIAGPEAIGGRPGYVVQGNQPRGLVLDSEAKIVARVSGEVILPDKVVSDVNARLAQPAAKESRHLNNLVREVLEADRNQRNGHATEFGVADGMLFGDTEQPRQVYGRTIEDEARAPVRSVATTHDSLSLLRAKEKVELATERIAHAMEVMRKLRLESGQGPGQGGDQYVRLIENPFQAVKDHPLSTFSIDVDTASYANVRRFLMQENRLPPPDAVRIEELVNYFDYDYSGPTSDVPFASHIEVAACPWAPEHRLVRVALKGHEIQTNQRPASNLVFLLDVSGSMSSQDKLPLLQAGMKLLAGQLSENDRVAIVVYAGSEGLVLPSTVGDQRAKVLDAIDRLKSGGSTNGGAGIELAYKVAQEHFIEGGVNRVILCTDGDFNVGTTSTGALERMVEEKARSGVFLSVLGFGRGNLNDAMMETISNKGNGNYAYIDGITEAQKVLVEQMGGTLITIAKDVKIQVEFNPMQVEAYRLIGYENRMLAAEDFNDDKKDAGEIGAGHTVTALYELVPAGGKVELPDVDPLKYQVAPKRNKNKEVAGEMLTLKLRYKQPDGDTSELLEFPVSDGDASFSKSSPDFQFAAAVASFGMLLRGSQYRGMSSYDAVLEIAQSAKGDDKHGYRAEFVQIVERAKPLGEERTARLEEVRKLLEAAKEAADRDDPKPLTGLQGIVLAATPDNVEISLGSDDGVLLGHVLDVYRTADGSNTYLAKIQVIKTMPDKAVCKVLPQFRKGEIKASDRVLSQQEK